MDNGQTITYEPKDSIKLVKNAKGKYQWEVKIVDLDVAKLATINADLERRFG